MRLGAVRVLSEGAATCGECWRYSGKVEPGDGGGAVVAPMPAQPTVRAQEDASQERRRILREREGARADARQRAYKWRGEGVGERWAFERRWRCAREVPTKEDSGARRRCHLREREATRGDAMQCYKNAIRHDAMRVRGLGGKNGTGQVRHEWGDFGALRSSVAAERRARAAVSYVEG